MKAERKSHAKPVGQQKMACSTAFSPGLQISVKSPLSHRYHIIAMTGYLYKSLVGSDNIRLIHLKAGDFEAPIEDKIITASLSEGPDYCALSYAWGSDEKPSTLVVDEGDVAITASLNSALKSLRSSTESVVLWADVVCLQVDEYRRKHLGNLRFGPLFYEGFRLCPVKTNQNWRK